MTTQVHGTAMANADDRRKINQSPFPSSAIEISLCFLVL